MNEKEFIEETRGHINKVIGYMVTFCTRLGSQMRTHDASKLVDPEKSIFIEYTPKLKDTTYGSEEYKTYLTEMKVALDHHYAENPHHPEYFKNGIKDMTLADIVEMLCDWIAASERHADGDIYKSIEINQERFGYSDDLKQIFLNTAYSLKNKKGENNGLK